MTLQLGGEVCTYDSRQVLYYVNLYELNADMQPTGLPVRVACATTPAIVAHEGDETIVHAIFTLRSICSQLEDRWNAILESRRQNIHLQVTIDEALDNQ